MGGALQGGAERSRGRGVGCEGWVWREAQSEGGDLLSGVWAGRKVLTGAGQILIGGQLLTRKAAFSWRTGSKYGRVSFHSKVYTQLYVYNQMCFGCVRR